MTGDLWVKNACKKAFALLNRLYRCGSVYLPLPARRMLVNAMIVQYKTTGGIPNTGISVLQKRKLQRAQNSCMRFIYQLNSQDSLSPLYTTANCPKIDERQTWLLLVLFYKAIVKGNGPAYLSEKFTRPAEIHTHNTRQREFNFIPPSKEARNNVGVVSVCGY